MRTAENNAAIELKPDNSIKVTAKIRNREALKKRRKRIPINVVFFTNSPTPVIRKSKNSVFSPQ